MIAGHHELQRAARGEVWEAADSRQGHQGWPADILGQSRRGGAGQQPRPRLPDLLQAAARAGVQVQALRLAAVWASLPAGGGAPRQGVQPPGGLLPQV